MNECQQSEKCLKCGNWLCFDDFKMTSTEIDGLYAVITYKGKCKNCGQSYSYIENYNLSDWGIYPEEGE